MAPINVADFSKMAPATIAGKLQQFGDHELQVKSENGVRVLYAKPRPGRAMRGLLNLIAGRQDKREAAKALLSERLSHITDQAILVHLHRTSAKDQAKAFQALAARPLPAFGLDVMISPEYHGTQGEFRRFLQKVQAAENLDFLQQIHRFPAHEGADLRNLLSAVLAQLTLDDDDESCVNLRGQVRLEVAAGVLHGQVRVDGCYVPKAALAGVLKPGAALPESSPNEIRLSAAFLRNIDWDKAAEKNRLSGQEIQQLFQRARVTQDLAGSLRDQYSMFAKEWRQGQSSAA